MPPTYRVLVVYFDMPDDVALYLITMTPEEIALARRCNGHMVNARGTDGPDTAACLLFKEYLKGKKPLEIAPGAPIPYSMCDEVVSTGWGL